MMSRARWDELADRTRDLERAEVRIQALEARQRTLVAALQACEDALLKSLAVIEESRQENRQLRQDLDEVTERERALRRGEDR